MKLTLKLNIGNYQSIDFESNRHRHKEACYRELYDFLSDWIEFTGNAIKIRNNLEGVLRR